MSSLKNQAVSGVKWLAINQIVQRVIRMIAFAILARLLEPTVFGLFAMAFILIDGFSYFKSFGVDGALIQRKEDETFETATHTAFFMLQILGVVIFLIFQLSAPMFARFLKNEEAITIMRALGVIFIINNLGRIPNALLTKKMRFSLLSVIELIAAVVNAVCAVIFAYLWKSVWSLVLAYLIKMIVTSCMTWYFERYRVKWVFDWKIAKEMLHFGKFMVGMGIVSYIAYNLDQVLISRMLGAAMLGYYVLALNITSFTQQNVLNHIGRVLFPAFAAIQDEPEIVKRGFLKTARYISIIAIPFTLGIVTVAREFTLALYGEKWLEIVPLIQVLALSQIIGPSMSGAGAVFMGCGKVKWSYNLTLARLLVKVPLVIIMGKLWGLMGIACTGLVMQFIFIPIVYVLVSKLVDFTFLDFVKQLVPSMICSAIMVAVILGVKAALAAWPQLVFFNFHELLPLIYFALFGLPAYLVSFYFIDRALVKDVFNMLFRLKKA